MFVTFLVGFVIREISCCLCQTKIKLICGGCVALPHGVMALSAVCDCGISRPYSLF